MLSSPWTYLFPLCIVGLNSAWLQYSDSDFERKLSLPTRQFQAVLPHAGISNPLDIFKRYRRTLLMLHHPPSWLSPAAQNISCSEIFLPNRFDMCLYGHMHAESAKQVISTAQHSIRIPKPITLWT